MCVEGESVRFLPVFTSWKDVALAIQLYAEGYILPEWQNLAVERSIRQDEQSHLAVTCNH